MNDSTESHDRRSWLLLIHQIPPKPDYFRVKIRRRLHALGAVPLKSSVYVLPAGEDSLESFQWLAQEIVTEGGEASICEAALLSGTSDAELIAAFQSARAADYAEVAAAARDGTAEPERLRSRLARVAAIDHFDAPGRDDAEAALAARETPMTTPKTETAPSGATWVTRGGVYVDRIASAWLIRRFIDPAARFRFVPPKGYEPAPAELRFDMYEGEYTHQGDHCTFEVLCDHFKLKDAGLRTIAEIVHDLDCRDDKFERPEAPGIKLVLDGIVRAHSDDHARLERGAAMLDDLYAHLSKGRK